jgi:hypothetical protein
MYYTVAVGGVALHILGQVNDHDGRKWALIEKKMITIVP